MEKIARNDDVKKLEDPKWNEKQDWINALEKDFPSCPYYFFDLVCSYVQAHPEEADAVMRGSLKMPEAIKLAEWKKNLSVN